MKNKYKTKRQLIEELEALQKQADKLKKTETRAKQAGKPSLAAQYWQTMFDAINNAVSIIDRNGKITQCNKAMASLLQKPTSEIIGHTCWELMHSSTKPIPECPIVRMKKSLKRETLTLPLIGRWFEITADPIIDKRGKFAGAVHIIADITERKQAEETLQKSEEKYRDLYDNAPDMYHTLDENGVILDCNETEAKMLGYKKEEIIGRPVTDFFTEESRRLYGIDFPQLKEKKALFNLERELVRKDGTTFQASLNVFSEYDEKGKFVGTKTISRDITIQKRAEKEVLKAKEFSDSLITLMKDGFSVLDSHGVHINVNPALCQMTGFSREELIGTGLPHPYWPPEEHKKIERAFQKTLQGEFSDFELTFMRQNGERFPAIVSPSHIKDKQGNIINYFATIKDITERKQVEEEVRQLNKSYDRLTDNADEAIFRVEAEGGHVIYCNPAAERIFGYSLAEWQADPALGFKMIHPDYKEKQKQVIEQINNNKQPVKNVELGWISKDGKTVLVEYSIIPICNAKGEIIFFESIGKDITERKRVEMLLQESQAKYKTIFEATGTATLIVEEDTTIIMANRECFLVSGYSAEELIGTKWTNYVAPESLEIMLKYHKLRREEPGKAPRKYEVKLVNKNGEIRNAILDVGVIPGTKQSVVSMLDITERKKAEELLQKSDALLKETQQISKVGGWELDVETGKITWTDEVYRIYGVSTDYDPSNIPEDMSFYTPDSLPILKEAFQKALEKGEPYDLDLGFINAKGEHLWVRTIGKPILRNDKVVRISGNIMDITERKKAEEELRTYQNRLRSLASQMSLIEEKERRRIAIELHDSIGQSLALAKLKLEGMRSLDSFSYLVEPIDELLDIMNQTISQTRSLTSEISPPVLYELGFEPAVMWLGEKLLKQKGIIFEFISDGQPKPLTDDIRIILFQSVRELLVNILKHSNAKSVIVSIKRDGDYLQFTIEDDGIGFDTSRIVSTESFGIFNIRERIKLIGGSIEIQSEPGKGTQITIRVSLKR